MAGTVQAHLANFFPRIRRSYCVQILGQNRLNFWPKIEKWATVGDHRFFAGPIGSKIGKRCGYLLQEVGHFANFLMVGETVRDTDISSLW